MVTLISILMMVANLSPNTPPASQEQGIYIYAVAPKMKGQYDFIFLEPSKTNALKTYYRFIFKNGKLATCKKSIFPKRVEITKMDDGNIVEGKVINGREIIYYSEKGFKDQRKIDPTGYYDILAPNFLELTNQEKLKVLDKLILEKTGKPKPR